MEKFPLEKSSYSWHFNRLKYLGAWLIDSKNGQKLNGYVFYKTTMTVFAFLGSFSLFLDLYYVFGDFKKMTWNLCITTLFVGGLLKNIYTIYRSRVINRLRKNLHENATSRDSIEDENVNRMGFRELKNVRILFYSSASIFVPVWLITYYLTYLWGEKKIPIPFTLPFEFDYDDRFQYNIVFFSVGIIGCAGITLVLETELAMFTILVQISREYNRFLNDLKKINQLFEEGSSMTNSQSSNEVNPFLRNVRVKKLVKNYFIRQQQLIEYTEDFELSYSYSMLLQMFVGSVLVIVSAMQCILEYDSISLHIAYQLGYLVIIIMDLFLVCWFATRIRGQCLKVGEEAYTVLWYQMDIEIQKDICMMIMRSQHPPKITSGKLMEMNLNAFMIMVRNIYSWLALFQQLAFKSKE